MKRRTKRITALLLTGVMAFSMVGCGGKTTNSATTATDDNSPVTIKITWWGSDTRHAYTQQLLDLYSKEHPNITFEATPAGWAGYFDKLSTQVASGSMPDIVQMDYSVINTFSQNGSLADLSEFTKSGVINTSKMDQNILNSGIIGGKTTGIPVSTSILSVTYNPAVLAAAGAKTPTDTWTWDDYIALNKAVTAKTGQVSALNSITGPFADCNLFNYWVRQNGGALFSADNKKLGFTDDTITSKFFQMWKDLSDAKVAPNADEQAQLATTGKETLGVVTGTAGTTIEWNNYPNIVSTKNDTLKLALMPSASSSTKPTWLKPGMFLSVSSTSKVKAQCAKFIDWFANSDEANAIINGERGVPVSSDERNYLIGLGKMTNGAVEMFKYVDTASKVAGSTPAPDPVGIAEINKALADAGNSVLYGTATAAGAAATFRTKVNSILAANN